MQLLKLSGVCIFITNAANTPGASVYPTYWSMSKMLTLNKISKYTFQKKDI